VRLDARKPLRQLNDEWSSCTKCDLGQRRLDVGGAFVRGEGAERGIMLIGEGPGKDEERQGRPFIGRSGQLLRKMLGKLNITEDCYITNIVACRSCFLELDEAGDPRYTTVRGAKTPRYRDKPPTPAQIEACLPRLYEEIYLVDPLVIVLLGGPAASALLQRSVTITKEQGKTEHLEVPGVGRLPVYTDKRRDWVRKVKGQYVAPTRRNIVRYMSVPAVHPAYASRLLGDRSPSGPVTQLFLRLTEAAKTFATMANYYGITITNRVRDDVSFDISEEFNDDE